MAVQLNHTIVWCRDGARSAAFLAGVLGRPQPHRWGPFTVVTMDNAVELDFHATTDPIAPQHYAFLITESDFDAVLERLRADDLAHWADASCRTPGINHNDGGRGTYFRDPDGHVLEVITRPYGDGDS